MKGKNKLVIALFAVMALVVTSVAFALNGAIEKIRYATAAPIDAFTAELEGGVIFSAERVYFANIWTDKDGDGIPDDGEVDGWTDGNDNDVIDVGELSGVTDLNRDDIIDVDELETARTTSLKYQGKVFNSIQTNKGTEYFMDYALTGDNSATSKHIINNGDFVMVDDNDSHTADVVASSTTKPIKQGIMITLGGYFKHEDDIITNYSWKDKDGDGEIDVGEVIGWNDRNGNGTMDAGEVEGAEDINENGVIDINELPDIGANMDYVSAQAFLNGEAIELPNARGYNNSSAQDFTWFIIPNQDTEGRYEISFVYMKDGKELRYDFEFYLLLQSSYEENINVNDNYYTSKPTISNSGEPVAENSYKFFSGTSLNYPMLTFDYARYDLSYTHVSGDVTTEVDFDYDEAMQVLSLSQTVYNDTDAEYYMIDTDPSNSIVTLMFVEHGKYNFHFDYIYKYQGTKITIPQEQIPFQNLVLDIHGYQLKYSKAGFASADMTYLEIYKNGTMFILVDGFINANNETIGDNLGVNYKLLAPTDKEKTGTISDTSKTAGIIGKTNELTDWSDADLIVDYQKTDRGLWLTLNDEYYLTSGTSPIVQESYYYYHPTKSIKSNFIKGSVDKEGKIYLSKDASRNRKNFEKVTTFTAPGYYLVQVKYDYIPGTATDDGTQFFAFQITSATPKLELYKTKAESYSNDIEKDDFYAHEYTNQNVYANWAKTEIFESTIVGKLYYSAGKYATETDLKRVADGGVSSQITKVDYNKYDIIKDSASYLLVLEVERSATKTYTYFTIDKEDISGFEIYEIVTSSIDNRAIYSIKQDSNLNYISHTSKSVIDTLFTIDWADKNSGAKINATYKLIPFIKTTIPAGLNKPIPVQDGTTTYKYIVNEYQIGKASNPIAIYKPTQLNASLDVNNVLTDQGVYEFNLEDQAGNKLTYIIVVDRTEGVVNATYGEKQNPYVSGQMVADYVELEWGTHKAIDLGSSVEGVIEKLLDDKSTIDNYYKDSINNLFGLKNMFETVETESGIRNLFIVENVRAEIRLHPLDKNPDYYILTSDGRKQIKHANGITSTGWDETANKLFITTEPELDGSDNVIKDGTYKDIKVLVDEEELRRYTFEVVGANKVSSSSNKAFTVYITPDKAQGEVYSSSQERDYNNTVMAYGGATKYSGESTDGKDNINIEKYYQGQASDDGVFVFEWLPESDQDKFEVIEVKYNYYQLMDQSTLNTLTSRKDNMYYPYKYVRTDYILQTEVKGEDRLETVSQYNKTTRIVKDEKGNIIENKNVCQSKPINLAYETYYQTAVNGEPVLTSKTVTQTGLYIITRTIAMKDAGVAKPETSQFSYAFFVDRNMIVGYSLADVNQKIVGQFIHASMPNSNGEVFYDNFNKQGLTPKTQTWYNANNEPETIKYQVYLETNKLPTKIQVPTGKYVSGEYDTTALDKDISKVYATSHVNLNLRLSVYYLDTYNILPTPYKGAFMQLMDNVTGNEDGYINFKYESFNQGALAVFKNARIHGEDGSLSLPGEYVFVISDTVGKELEDFEVKDYNKFIFGVKLTNKAPQTDVYAYANIDGHQSDKVYADGYELHTNQQYVDFIIPVEQLKSYDAQLDIASIEIWRASLNEGGRTLWLKLKSDGSGGFVADATAIEKNTRYVYWLDKDGNILEQTDPTSKDKLNKYMIKLYTGLEVVDNQIISYEEYVYTIDIRYILTNSSTKYYEYKSTNNEGNTTTNSFYKSTYTVTIDRTPNDVNLNELMREQGNYFTEYHKWLANQHEVSVSNNINQNYAYRSTKTVSDYYGLSNKLYYQFAQNNEELSNEAMYALTVDFETTFNPNGLSAIYYRELDFNEEIDAKTRMGLLPITDTYFETSQYYTFNESSAEYKYLSTNTNNTYYWLIMNLSGETQEELKYNYDNYRYGKFYEIIEKDMAGNLTQYVIYFAPDEASNVKITIDDKDEKTESVTIQFANNDKVDQRTFIGISDVTTLSGLADNKYNDDSFELNNPYYGNINIYNSSREKIKTIYINSTSIHNKYTDVVVEGDKTEKVLTTIGFENEIYETIKEQGSYILEYVNVFGQKFTAVVNNYTAINKLNISMLKIKEDSLTGQSYITFSELNTMVDESTSTYWYVTNVKISYDSGNKNVEYTAMPPQNGKTKLELVGSRVEEVVLDSVESDRLNLKKGIHYLVTVTDVIGKEYVVPLSTTDDKAFDFILPDNTYSNGDVYYTANEVKILYNIEFYEAHVSVWESVGESGEEFKTLTDAERDAYYTNQVQSTSHNLIVLKPDVVTNPADHYGSLRRFEVQLELKHSDDASQMPTYNVYIDTRTTAFRIENTNKEDKIDFVKSTLKNDKDENGVYDDYYMPDLDDRKYYADLITETINISWTRRTSNYFTYNYELYEFETGDNPVELLKGSTDTTHPIEPREGTTGKYIFKVEIRAKDNTWIATRVFGIFMSTTITGLYEVKNGNGEVVDYTSITNLKEVMDSIGGNPTKMAEDLGFKATPGKTAVNNMDEVFASFGYKTAIPMYISNQSLTLHSNEDNGVSSEPYKAEASSYAQITFYRIHRSNYQTFAVIMEVYPTDKNQNILSVLSFTTSSTKEGESLLNGGTAKTIYDANAEFYKLTFNSYNRNTGANPLERHNKIVIDVYYNNVFAKRIKGGDESVTSILFENSGNYTLKISDKAGNKQYFSDSVTYSEDFRVVVMKDVLYTIKVGDGESARAGAPIQYAYYDRPVTLQINRNNDDTDSNNDINIIQVGVMLNSRAYTGYEHVAGSSTYVFKDYGTYLVTMSVNLVYSGETIKSQLVFTILNPNEARRALDFTSIYGYNIKSVHRIIEGVDPKDVTSQFMDLLQDKSNIGEVNVYNKLITYERLVEAFGTATQGKMKFRVLYEVKNDDLLPARLAEFSFTLNNETATITSSIKAGGKTTDEVTLKFNALNVYDQVGDCTLLINGEFVCRIDESLIKEIQEDLIDEIISFKVTEVGQYYIQLMGDSGNVAHSFSFTIKEPLNTVAIILIVVVVAIVIGLIATFIWLRTRMKVR